MKHNVLEMALKTLFGVQQAVITEGITTTGLPGSGPIRADGGC